MAIESTAVFAGLEYRRRGVDNRIPVVAAQPNERVIDPYDRPGLVSNKDGGRGSTQSVRQQTFLGRQTFMRDGRHAGYLV